MSTSKFIPIPQLCEHYQVEHQFFMELHEKGIIEIISTERSHCIPEDSIVVFEKIIRMQRDLHVNLEGIAVILNLLDKIDTLQNELTKTRNRLGIYE
ncbi:MAG: chaperone modulator CbpM [Leeuwenhoekiella sp.]